MFINPYYSDDVNVEIEKVVNPYFLSTLAPASAFNPYLSSSAKNIYLSPTKPYLLSPTITIKKEKDDKDKDDKDKEKKLE